MTFVMLFSENNNDVFEREIIAAYVWIYCIHVLKLCKYDFLLNK